VWRGRIWEIKVEWNLILDVELVGGLGTDSRGGNNVPVDCSWGSLTGADGIMGLVRLKIGCWLELIRVVNAFENGLKFGAGLIR
jgi:hypothetical protein